MRRMSRPNFHFVEYIHAKSVRCYVRGADERVFELPNEVCVVIEEEMFRQFRCEMNLGCAG